MPYAEEKEFTFRLELRREFADDYDGDDDGYAWAEAVPGMAAEMMNAIVAVAARHGWKVHPRNRGRSTDDEVTLVATK